MEKRFDKVLKFVERYIKQIVILIVLTAVCAPILVWLCYSVFPTFIYTEITADGMLSYLGTIIGGGVSLLVAIVALYQAGVIHRLDQEQADLKRRQDICPSLQISLFVFGEGYCLDIHNHSANPAIGIYLFEYSFSPVINNDHFLRRFIVFQETDDADALYVDPSFVELSENGFPKKIDLYYNDIDRHTISQSFRLVDGDQYEPCSIEYMS